MTSRPYLSVILGAHRRSAYLLEALRTVLSQEFDRSRYEVVVIKDFQDPTIDAFLDQESPTVRPILEDHPVMGDMLASAVAQAEGEVLCFLDDDDRYRPGKLAGVANLFRAEPRLGFVRNASLGIDAEGRPLPSYNRTIRQVRRSFEIDGSSRSWDDLRRAFRGRASCNASQMAIRAELVRPWLGYLRRLPCAPDAFYFLVAAAGGARLRLEASVWNDYRFHSTSAGHVLLGPEGTKRHLAEVLRHRPTAQALNEIARQFPDRPMAQRFADSFFLETEASLFLLDPERHWSIDGWLRLARSALGMRDANLGLCFALSAYKALRPARGAALFQEQYRRYLQRMGGVGPRLSGPG